MLYALLPALIRPHLLLPDSRTENIINTSGPFSDPNSSPRIFLNSPEIQEFSDAETVPPNTLPQRSSSEFPLVSTLLEVLAGNFKNERLALYKVHNSR
ncbi:MAG: hypothetical protein LBC55_08315 [Desulfovibrio sp.]|nr:hypothetical protein [Desulfovibrio sp.]